MISPLSQAQLSIYLSCQGLSENDGNYQLAMLFRLPESVNVESLQTALQKTVSAHPYMASRLLMQDGEPCMETPDDPQWESEIKTALDRTQLALPMPLKEGEPLLKLEIYKTPEGNYFYFDIHHILFDGASVPLFLQSLSDAYGGAALEREAFSGADVALKEKAEREGEAFPEARTWYAQEFGAAAELESQIIPDRYGADEPYKELVVDLGLDRKGMQPILEKYRYADSVLFTTAFGLTLAAWNAEEKAIFTTIWNGRKGPGMKSISMQVHTLPVFVDAPASTPLKDVFDKAMAQTKGIRSRAFYSIADCAKDLGISTRINFGFQGQMVQTHPVLKLGELEIEGEDLRTNPPGISLSAECFTPAEGPYQIRFWYRSNQYSEDIIRNFAQSFEAVVKSLATAETVGDLDYTAEAQKKVLEGFRAPEDRIPEDQTVVDLFRENARKHPDQAAVTYKEKTYTYKEADALTDKLAAYIEKTVGPGKVVSIILGRNEYMFLAPVGVLKAGCCYQPLDPSYPPERLQYMIKDADAALLISDGHSVEGYEGPVLHTEDIASLPKGKPASRPGKDDLATLLYTSGTTGDPKGCMLPHRSLSLYGRRNAANVGITSGSTLAAYASFGFDAFVGDLVDALASGAPLHIVPEEIRLDLPALQKYYEDSGVTHVLMTTQVAVQFITSFPQCKGLEALLTGGEKMPRLPLPEYRLFNCYGPSESLCYTVSKEVKASEENIPIGKPLPGIRTYVVSKSGRPLPPGAIGELWTAGEQVGDGYLNKPDKTAEAFMDNPFDSDPAYRRTYRTGDIVRFRPDGDIEFIGRKDSQVKIRGFRIELKEVEGVIRDYPGINDVTVQAFDEEGGTGKFIAAYIVADSPVDIEALNAFISERKPPYMVPAVTLQIDAIPLNVNQKVDRKALPRPTPAKKAATTENAPFNILEEEIAAIIRETAHIDGFGLTDPLLYYGLSSLSALRLATELYKKYGLQADMASFAKTASLQSIENEVLKVLMSDERKAGAAAASEAPVAEPRELTFQQEGVFYDCMKAPWETQYNIPMLWRFPEGTTPEAVKAAVLDVLEAHPRLNVSFEQRDGKVFAVPSDEAPVIETEQLSDNITAQSFKEQFVKPFNLQKAPLYRIKILSTPEGVVLATDFHHLIFDGASYDIFGKQLSAAIAGTRPQKEAYTYAQYALDQKKSVDGDEFKAAEAFFGKQLEAFEEASEILPDLPAREEKGQELYVQEEVNAPGIAAKCRELGITPASYFLAAAYMAVSAFTGKRSAYICTVSGGRSNLRTSETMGMFVNTLALAGDVRADSIDNYLKNVHEAFSDTLRHENYPFSRIAAKFGFQPKIMLAYEVGVVESYPGLKSEIMETGYPKFPVSIFVDGEEDKERLVMAYDNSLYSEGIMRHFARTMAGVASGMLKAGNTTEVPFLDAPALEQLDGFNHYSTRVDLSETIVSLFRSQAAATPDAVAVWSGGKAWTYREVDRISDRLAAHIHSLGLGPEQAVSVLIGRNEWMVLASMGILKAGCAYQPLDPSYPAERLKFMIGDAGASLLIADEDLVELLPDFDGKILKTKEIESLPEGAVPEGPAPESLFILLYTSGSTGVPKGVMLEHRNLVNFCAWYRSYYGLQPSGRVAAYASYGFDASMMDMYPALTTGAAVYIIPEDTRHDMAELDRFITDNGITHSFMTTQVGVMYAKNFPTNGSIRHLSVGGEKLVSINPPAYSFHNGYGPTECTIFSTIFQVKEKEDNIPIGHPLDNVFTYVVDHDFRRLPVGAPGELLIAGDGVGRGYLNQEEKTAEAFIPNPFVKGMRAYRSGDIVRYREDGNIEFVGRRDSQVKIRGFRIETKEVESVIREMPGVKDVTVQAFDKPSGGKFLAAYVVFDGTLDTAKAAAFIRERKPPYMVPESFTQIDAIPLNVNQKVDRKALPSPTPKASEGYVAPETPAEKILCEVFASVLEMEKVSVTDNFFDLGGTSLVVTNVLVSAQKAGLNFAYADVFSHPTARSLAAFLEGTQEEKPENKDVADYDYSDIDRLLAGNTLEAFLGGERQPLGKNILLTGVTGYLGVHVLRELIRTTTDDTIVWCIIRARQGSSTMQVLKDMFSYYFEDDYTRLLGRRIRIVQGDITQPSVFQSLLDSGTAFDLVINCAANVKHFSKGTDIEDVNYGGAKNVVDFCERNRARLVHISTESVGGSSKGVQPVVFKEQQLWFGQLTTNQYVHSKFLAERHILQHMAEGLINAKILRCGNLASRSADGEFQKNMNTNTSMGRLKAIKRLGKVPYASTTQRVEFTPIDEAARAVVLLAGTPRENCVLHVSNNHLVPMEDVVERLAKVDGKPLKYVETQEFGAALQQAMADPEMARSLSALVAYTRAADDDPEVINWPSTSFTVQILLRLGFHWNTTSAGYLDQMFDFLKRMGYFNS